MSILHLILVTVVLLRLVELIHSYRNAKRLLESGGVEYGRKHYPLLVLIHISWIISIWLVVPSETEPSLGLLCVFIALQFCRFWVIASLGRYWTTRVISSNDFPIVVRGPYRFMKHPNYLVVCAEIAVLPLVFGAVAIAIIFSILNAAALIWRIKIEESALELRRNNDVSNHSL